MARLNNHVGEEDSEVSFCTAAIPSRNHSERDQLGSPSPSPSASFSDKENRVTPRSTSTRKEKSLSMGPTQRPTPDSGVRPNKKRRLTARTPPTSSQAVHLKRLDEAGNSRFYDPNQSMEERRAVRKDYRDLSRDLIDQRGEFLTPGSDGLLNTLKRQNQLFESVKQTSDATLDSRLLVSTADLSAKRATQSNIGDASLGIDVDDFVSRCIKFMRHGPRDGNSTQRRRRQQEQSDDDDDENAGQNFDEGDAFDWEFLGHQTYQYSVRPPVPGFLLGPLSVQKRVRKVTQRRERLKRDPNDAIRPEQLKAQDMEKQENSNLTTICRNIRELLVKHVTERMKLIEQEAHDDMTEEQVSQMMSKYVISNDGGVPFFNFIVNPKSFGQSVENLFYVSFLIRDGLVGIGNDSRMLPSLHPTERKKASDAKPEEVKKHQAVFHLDFDTWEGLIEAFDIRQSIIPHRQPDPMAQASASGWYA